MARTDYTRTERADVYTRVTQAIIATIETGAGDWRMPWHHDGISAARPTNITTGKAYRGINTVSLWVSAQINGFTSGLWGTYRQWQDAGAQVRKDEKSSIGVLWKELRGSDDDHADDDDRRSRLFARAFNLFNLAQVDGYMAEPMATLSETERLERADAFISNLGIVTEFGDFRAYYHIGEDRIHMPDFAAFRHAHGFYATHLHECGHATGAKHRLDRDFTGRWSDHALAMEEATAELTAAFLLSDLSIANDPRPDHAAYVGHWLDLMKSEPRAIFTAASKAQAAADWMWAQQPPG